MDACDCESVPGWVASGDEVRTPRVIEKSSVLRCGRHLCGRATRNASCVLPTVTSKGTACESTLLGKSFGSAHGVQPGEWYSERILQYRLGHQDDHSCANTGYGLRNDADGAHVYVPTVRHADDALAGARSKRSSDVQLHDELFKNQSKEANRPLR